MRGGDRRGGGDLDPSGPPPEPKVFLKTDTYMFMVASV